MKSKDKIQLRVLGLSYTQLKNSAYMLILAQVGGPLNINIWIGEAEAHAIALAMEGVHTPRPLTHDLFASFIHAFGVKLTEVFIYKVEDDVFLSELTFTDGERTVTIDSRTSDGIAIAMRTGAPIYTTGDILEEKGFLLDIQRVDDGQSGNGGAGAPIGDNGNDTGDDVETITDSYTPRLEQYTIEQLEQSLQRCIETERYEEAARISDVLKRKKDSLK